MYEYVTINCITSKVLSTRHSNFLNEDRPLYTFIILVI